MFDGFRQACRQARAWRDAAVPLPTMAVNISAMEFRTENFLEGVFQILAETGLAPGSLELELTESTLLGNLETAELSMLRLKAIGVRFALDDFGTGYSSLLYLRRFPFDKLKIDSSFVRSIEKAPDAAAIVHAVVSLGRGLGMKVTAEGVETAEQHLFLRAAGVHSMQGYRFGKPGPASEINARLSLRELLAILRDRNVLLLALSYLAMNYVFYLLANWCFLYLVQQRGFSVLEGGWLAVAPPVTAVSPP